MPSETDYFLDFVQTVQRKGLVDDVEISEAFKYLDGLTGIISEKFFIFGYENLGWQIGEKASLHQIENFLNESVSFMEEDAKSRFYFAQALLEKAGSTTQEKEKLIEMMPERYKKHLKRKFVKLS